VSAYCHQQGVVTLTCGTGAHVFPLLPTLATTDALLHEALTFVARPSRHRL
jgi:4-aminobutyrate aminotransferase/(S)-3-amino-2-methylpropionate transaminase